MNNPDLGRVDRPSLRVHENQRLLDQQLLKLTHRNAVLGSMLMVCGASLLLFVSHSFNEAGSPRLASVSGWSVVVVLELCCHLINRSSVTMSRQVTALSFVAALQGITIGVMMASTPLLLYQEPSWFALIAVSLLCAKVLAVSGHRTLLASFVVGLSVTGLGAWWRLSVEQYSDFNVTPSLYVLLLSVVAVLLVARELRVTLRDSILAINQNRVTNQNLKAAVREARKANEAKTRFLASASHDLRQPINSLALFIASLKLQTETPEQQAIVESMTTAIKSIDSQLESLLDISKLDAGIVVVNNQEIELGRFCERIIGSLKETVVAPLRLIYRPPSAPVWTVSDPALLERVLFNLLTNSIKYTLKGHVSLSVYEQANDLVIEIQDTGIGIDRGELNRVFEEFYQVNNPHRDSAQGLGLGLSIVKRLATLLGLAISIRSSLGVGTSVQVRVKRSLPSRQTMTAVKVTAVASLGKNILVLDNEVAILDAMQLLLRRLGHRVTVFQTAKSAILEFTRATYHVAFVDYRLEGDLNGIDVIRKLQRLDPRTACHLITGDGAIRRNPTNISVIYKPLTAEKLAPLLLEPNQE